MTSPPAAAVAPPHSLFEDLQALLSGTLLIALAVQMYRHAVLLRSAETELLPQLVVFQALQPLYAAVMGGLLMGTGFLILFRHRASLGCVGIMALVLEERRGWRAGQVQMAVDCVIVAMALWLVEPLQVLMSIAGYGGRPPVGIRAGLGAARGSASGVLAIRLSEPRFPH